MFDLSFPIVYARDLPSFEQALDPTARTHTPTPTATSHRPHHAHVPHLHSAATATHSINNTSDASLPSLLRTIGPILGVSPSASAGSGGGLLSPGTPFVALYVLLLVALAWRRLRGTSAPARQVAFVPFFVLSRVLFFAMGWRAVRAPQGAGARAGHGHGHGHGLTDAYALAAAEAGTFAGWVKGVALLGGLGGMYFTIMRLFSDGMAPYHPSNSIAFGLLKIWPTTAVPVAAMLTALGVAVPSFTAAAISQRAPWAARWAHTLSLDAILLSCAVLIIHLLAILIAWACEPSNFRLTPGSHYDDAKEKSKLLALTMMTVALALPALYRCAAFLFDERYAWLHSPGAFYTLFCLPEALCLCLFVILPIKLVIPDPRTLLRVEIPDADLDLEGSTQLEIDVDEGDLTPQPYTHTSQGASAQAHGQSMVGPMDATVPASPAPRQGMEMASAFVPVLPASATAVMPVVGRG